MSKSRDHHRRVLPVQRLERRLLAELAARPALLPEADTARLRYGLTLARTGRMRAEAGEAEIDLFDRVAPFRHWLLDELERSVDPAGRGPTDWKQVARLIPDLTQRFASLREGILNHHAPRLSHERLDHELRHRELALVLGGGGGAGFAHLGLFATIAELGFTPRLIVGSSMGALMGLFRSLQHDYDPMLLALGLPKSNEFRRVFGPYPGYSVFGFPGTFELRIRELADNSFRTMLGTEQPRFADLPIAFRVMGTGLRTGIGVALSDVEREIGRAHSGFTPLALRSRFLLFRSVLTKMANNPRFLSRVVFGGDEGLEDFDMIDAVGYSCAVPGLIHFDNYDLQSPSAATLRELFAQRGFFRITDGGIASNVPARTAWDTVQQGDLGSRNAFILAMDVFAPLPSSRNLPWIPAQRLIRPMVDMDLPFADHVITYRSPPSPLRVLASWELLQKVISRSRAQLRPQRELLRLALTPLPPWETLSPPPGQSR